LSVQLAQEDRMGRTTNGTALTLGDVVATMFAHAEVITPDARVAARLASRSLARLFFRSNRMDCVRKLRRR
jgi:hypothetical protein